MSDDKDVFNNPAMPFSIIKIDGCQIKKKNLENKDNLDKSIEDWVKEAEVLNDKYGKILDYSKPIFEEKEIISELEFIQEAIIALNEFRASITKVQLKGWQIELHALDYQVFAVLGELDILKNKMELFKADKMLKELNFFGYPFR
jgi:hypothetical protein